MKNGSGHKHEPSLRVPVRGCRIAKRVLTVFILVFTLTLAVTGAILFISDRAEMHARRGAESHTVAIQAANIDSDIQQVFSDLAILANGRVIETLWSDAGVPLPKSLVELAEDFLNTAMYRSLYDQVRLLDVHGMEIARVNFNNGDPAVVPREALQNKKGRYYFDEALRLGRGEVFVSPLDLNTERGQIERPPKPMLRFATPVFDRRGRKRGVVLLNYFAAKLLQSLANQVDPSTNGQTMLLNADGYWLFGPKPEDEWGFMYKDRKDRTFAKDYPEVWERIKSSKSCQFETAQGLFTSETHSLLERQNSSTGSDKASSIRMVQL